MADLAANGAAVTSDLRDQPPELPAVRIGMAGGAGTVIEAEAHRRGLPAFRLVTLGALHRSVSFGQREASVFVSSDVEGGAAKILDRMAVVAAVEIG